MIAGDVLNLIRGLTLLGCGIVMTSRSSIFQSLYVCLQLSYSVFGGNCDRSWEEFWKNVPLCCGLSEVSTEIHKYLRYFLIHAEHALHFSVVVDQVLFPAVCNDTQQLGQRTKSSNPCFQWYVQPRENTGSSSFSDWTLFFSK